MLLSAAGRKLRLGIGITQTPISADRKNTHTHIQLLGVESSGYWQWLWLQLDVKRRRSEADRRGSAADSIPQPSNRPVCSTMTGVEIYVPDSGGRENRAARAVTSLAEHNTFWSAACPAASVENLLFDVEFSHCFLKCCALFFLKISQENI